MYMLHLSRHGGSSRHLHHSFICKDFTFETNKFTEQKAKITPRNWGYFWNAGISKKLPIWLNFENPCYKKFFNAEL